MSSGKAQAVALDDDEEFPRRGGNDNNDNSNVSDHSSSSDGSSSDSGSSSSNDDDGDDSDDGKSLEDGIPLLLKGNKEGLQHEQEQERARERNGHLTTVDQCANSDANEISETSQTKGGQGDGGGAGRSGERENDERTERDRHHKTGLPLSRRLNLSSQFDSTPQIRRGYKGNDGSGKGGKKRRLNLGKNELTHLIPGYVAPMRLVSSSLERIRPPKQGGCRPCMTRLLVKKVGHDERD